MAVDFITATVFSVPRDLAGRFIQAKTNTLERLRLAVIHQTEELVKQTQRNIASQFRNPALMQSAIGMAIRERGNTVTGIVDASGELSGHPLPFMGIQEYGGTVKTPAREALPG